MTVNIKALLSSANVLITPLLSSNSYRGSPLLSQCSDYPFVIFKLLSWLSSPQPMFWLPLCYLQTLIKALLSSVNVLITPLLSSNSYQGSPLLSQCSDYPFVIFKLLSRLSSPQPMFWLPLCYLQTLIKALLSSANVLITPLLSSNSYRGSPLLSQCSDYPFVIFKLLSWLSSPQPMFWLPLCYLQTLIKALLSSANVLITPLLSSNSYQGSPLLSQCSDYPFVIFKLLSRLSSPQPMFWLPLCYLQTLIVALLSSANVLITPLLSSNSYRGSPLLSQCSDYPFVIFKLLSRLSSPQPMFWLPLCYLQTLIKALLSSANVLITPLLSSNSYQGSPLLSQCSDYPFVIFKLLSWLSSPQPMFWLPLCYLQTLIKALLSSVNVLITPLLSSNSYQGSPLLSQCSDYPFVIFKLLSRLSSPQPMFWLPLCYLQTLIKALLSSANVLITPLLSSNSYQGSPLLSQCSDYPFVIFKLLSRLSSPQPMFWLPLCYLQTLIKALLSSANVLITPLLSSNSYQGSPLLSQCSDYPFVIFKLLSRLSSPQPMFWLPLCYLQTLIVALLSSANVLITPLLSSNSYQGSPLLSQCSDYPFVIFKLLSWLSSPQPMFWLPLCYLQTLIKALLSSANVLITPLLSSNSYRGSPLLSQCSDYPFVIFKLLSRLSSPQPMFWLPLCYLQTLIKALLSTANVLITPLLSSNSYRGYLL